MSERSRQQLWTLALWAFPLMVWLIATGWYGFDIGKYSDDWAVSLRTPETDIYQWPASPFIRWHYFWRPLHLIAVYGLATAFWHHDWVNHAISALAHLGVAALLYRLLRKFEIGLAPAMGAVSMFLVVPVSIEAVLWPAALGSIVGVGWFLLIALMCERQMRRGEVLAVGRQTRDRLALVVMGFLTACWHEQPAACVLALPALVLGLRSKGSGWRATVSKAVSSTIASGLGVGLYVLLFIATVPPGRRGGSKTLVGLGAAGQRVSRLVHMSWDTSLGARGQDATRDAFEIGYRTITGTPIGIATMVILAGIAIAWICACGRATRSSDLSAQNSSRAVGFRAWLAVFGVGIAIASVAPIGLVEMQPMQARYLYAAGLGAALVFAAGADAVLVRARRPQGKGLCTRTIASVAVIVGIGGAVCCVGWQTEFRRRSLADDAQMNQLRELVPSPARDAVFVPVELADSRTQGLRAHDPGIPGAMANYWSCWAYIQRGYGRSDLTATHRRAAQKFSARADEKGIHYPRGLGDSWGRNNPKNIFVPWPRALPFAVDRAGVVRLLTREEAIARMSAAH